MTSDSATHLTATRLLLTRIPDSWAWIRVDAPVRLLPFAVIYIAALKATSGATWLGFGLGSIRAQLVFALVAMPVLFVAAVAVQRRLTRRRGVLSVPAGASDAWFQAAFYALNGPLEEAFFRGVIQGGLTVLWGWPVGFVIATSAYVLYHRLGQWAWADTLATVLLGAPLGLAYALLPGPASLLGVSLAHVAATCGFLGPGPYMLRRLKLL